MGFYDSEIIAYLCITIVLFQVCHFLLYALYNHFLSVQLGISFVDFKYLGQWAVVTGATDGIGRAFANILAKKGMNVFIISRSQEKMDVAAQEIKSKFNVEVKTLAIDFTHDDKIYSVIEKHLADLEIGVLVNNVGISYPYPEFFLEVEDKDVLFSNIIRCNCYSVVNMCKIVMPGMVERKRGAIINMSSLAAEIPNPLLSVYSGTKAFVEKFSIDLATEYGSKGLTIQCLLPGYVATKMSKIRTETYLAPSPKTFVEEAIKTLGVHDKSTGYFAHTVMGAVIDMFPSRIANMLVMNTLLSIRRRALKQKIKQ